jgi:anaerobic ribonucleoside-triphosphate reductase activating protein
MTKKYDFTKELLTYIDVIVDGEYHENERNLSISFRGSTNQRIIDVKESLKQEKVVLDSHDLFRIGETKWKD